MIPRKPINTLVDDSMFIPLEQYKSKEVQEKVENKEQYDKTLRQMLSHMLQEKIRAIRK
jgi:hypothetical protein